MGAGPHFWWSARIPRGKFGRVRVEWVKSSKVNTAFPKTAHHEHDSVAIFSIGTEKL